MYKPKLTPTINDHKIRVRMEELEEICPCVDERERNLRYKSVCKSYTTEIKENGS